MTLRILAACSPGEVRIAVLAEHLTDYAVWRPGRPDGVGDLHRGRITAHVRALAGSFVALQGETLEGFLPDSDVEARPLAGQMLGVRIARAAQNGKGPRLTARLATEEAAQAEAGPVRLVGRGTNPILRFAARHQQADIHVDDLALVGALRPLLRERVVHVQTAFSPALEDEAAGLAAEFSPIRGGGGMRVQPTAALTAIDVDLGNAEHRGSKTAVHGGFNRALLPELARQIRLRNLSGAILVDLAGLSVRRRAGFGPVLQAALAEDPTTTRLVGFTGLGLAEIVRKRVHPPLHEVLSGPHAAIATALRSVVRQLPPGTRPRLLAAPAMIAAFREDPAMQQDLARGPGYALTVTADPALAPGGWRLQIDG